MAALVDDNLVPHSLSPLFCLRQQSCWSKSTLLVSLKASRPFAPKPSRPQESALAARPRHGQRSGADGRSAGRRSRRQQPLPVAPIPAAARAQSPSPPPPGYCEASYRRARPGTAHPADGSQPRCRQQKRVLQPHVATERTFIHSLIEAN